MRTKYFLLVLVYLITHCLCVHFVSAQDNAAESDKTPLKLVADFVFVYEYPDEAFTLSINGEDVFACLDLPKEEFFNPVDEYLSIVQVEDNYLLYECSRNFPTNQNLLQFLTGWDPNNFVLGYRSGLLASESTVSVQRGSHFRIDRLEGTLIIRQDSIEQGFYGGK